MLPMPLSVPRDGATAYRPACLLAERSPICHDRRGLPVSRDQIALDLSCLPFTAAAPNCESVRFLAESAGVEYLNAWPLTRQRCCLRA